MNFKAQLQNLELPDTFHWLHVSNTLETYRLPIRWTTQESSTADQAKIASDPASGCEIADAFFYTEFTDWLLRTSTQEKLLTPNADAITHPPKLTLSPSLPCYVNQKDQTNTCLFYGDSLFLKFYRKVETQRNRECETLAALETHQESFSEARVYPKLLAEVRHSDSTVWCLQEQIARSQNLWNLSVQQLNHIERTFASSSSALFKHHTGFEQLRAYSKTCGQALAILHRQLSLLHVGHYANHALEPDALFLQWERLKMEWDASSALPKALKHVIQRLEIFWQDFIKQPAQAVSVREQRIHGDLHLGQLLWNEASQLYITDFDQEPIRTKSESPATGLAPCEDDLAAMMRSWEYLLDQPTLSQTPIPIRQEMKRTLSCDLLDAYTAKLKDFDFPGRAVNAAYLNYQCLAKSLRECEYEWRYRPDWLSIPLRGVEAHLTRLMHPN